MRKSKLISLLLTFDDEEFKRFGKFLESPYYNTNKKVLQLYNHLKKYAPGFNSKAVEKEAVFRKLYPGKKYNDGVLRVHISDLLKHAQDFLVTQSFKRNDSAYYSRLLSELLNRRIDSLFLKEYDEIAAGQQANLIGSEHFKNMYQIENIRLGFNVDTDRQPQNSENLMRMADYVLAYFLIDSKNILKEIDAAGHNFNVRPAVPLLELLVESVDLEALINRLGNYPGQQNEILEIFLSILLMMRKGADKKHYYRTKELFHKNFEHIERELIDQIYSSLHGYCIIQAPNDTNEEFSKEAFELLKEIVERSHYSNTVGGYMTLIFFRNILVQCSKVGDFKYMEKFIRRYIEKIQPEHRENMRHYSAGRLYFVQKNFGKALRELAKVNYDLFTFKYDVKCMMLQAYYELNYTEEAYSMVDSFRHFLSKNKSVSEGFNEVHSGFLNSYAALLNHRTGTKQTDLDSLKRYIQDNPGIVWKKWLLEKVAEQISSN